uniref:F5/8 type C domain-containing protein n=1 Tax=Chromera velia CCMP2878 TaxID=1169474 RepID=A0A0G4GQK2_9ALVE|mmetsp:Transcript_27717/g.54366  ORF Transcript_27717/g.54366 Transcript_27717/m.54366 type:complete len:140 (+) Transcript_27717:326-745(+)|eukprot:Cvel_702.t1-p1 / transcript=Cvel_702.t1 / gene=Cvel_702 / organism=Chromera_velia_CCMP2878 / gene_product=Heat shock protein beta-11, putative / transcript_product=Heat shock protein beta-11, putative / location=Cvel_scaffold22:5535-8627(-) / protein_length=139 / sequence_SO=supercontig / SO=protein_coding / is_pseudo=false
MPDLALLANGGKIVFASSVDDRHPPENMLDGDEKTFWISTGLFPQEIVIELGGSEAQKVSSLRFSGSNIKTARVEVSTDSTPSSFSSASQETEYPNRKGEVHGEVLSLNGTQSARFVKFVVTGGWDSFVSLHKISVGQE